jgi:hypothetical protein
VHRPSVLSPIDVLGHRTTKATPLVQAGGGVELTRAPSVLRVRADCGGRLFAPKLAVVVHYLSHQLLDHLLTDDPILLARQFCDFEALLHGTTVSRCHHVPRLSA